MVEFDDDIFAAGNCFDWNQHPKKKGLFCPFAFRLPYPNSGASLAKDLAAEYHYLGNTSEWFFLARKNAERVIAKNEQYIKGTYMLTILISSNISSHHQLTCISICSTSFQQTIQPRTNDLLYIQHSLSFYHLYPNEILLQKLLKPKYAFSEIHTLVCTKVKFHLFFFYSFNYE